MWGVGCGANDPNNPNPNQKNGLLVGYKVARRICTTQENKSKLCPQSKDYWEVGCSPSDVDSA